MKVKTPSTASMSLGEANLALREYRGVKMR